MIFDEIKIMQEIQKINLSEQMRVISYPFNTNGYIIIVFCLFIYSILNTKDVILLTSVGIIGGLLKFIFRRTRPYIYTKRIINYSGKEHNYFSEKYSFPSGHTFNATIFSLLMLYKYPNEFIFSIIPLLVGFSRISLGVHYPTDILSGIIFGYIFFKLLI